MIGEAVSKRPRGLAAMSPERRREVASKGGRTSQARGTAHQWTAEEASAAGKKGSARYALRKTEAVFGQGDQKNIGFHEDSHM